MTKIAVIRIRGLVGVRKELAQTLHRLRLRRKYACVVFDNPSDETLGMIRSVRDSVSYGEISEEVYKELVEKRGKKDTEGNLKPFFRLHPPRGGANTRLYFPKGILGENKKIDELVGRML